MAKPRPIVIEGETEREAKAEAGRYSREYEISDGKFLGKETMGGLVHAALLESRGVGYKDPESKKVTVVYEGDKAHHTIACSAIAERLIYGTDKEVADFSTFSKLKSKEIEKPLSQSQALIDTILSKKLKECQDNVKRLQKYCQKNKLTKEGKLADQLSQALQESDTLSSLRAFKKALFEAKGGNLSIAEQLNDSANRQPEESGESKHPVLQFLKDAISTLSSSLLGKASDAFENRLSNPMEKVIEDFRGTLRYGTHQSIYHKIESEEKGMEGLQDKEPGSTPTPGSPR